MGEEIDLQHQVVVLLRSWLWLSGAAAGAALVALGASLLLRPVYLSWAEVVILRGRTEIRLEPKIQTVEGRSIPAGKPGMDSYRDTFVALVTSTEVAQAVIDRAGPSLPGQSGSAEDLISQVEMALEGDVVKIGVKHSDPRVAASLANHWASAYADFANHVFGFGHAVLLGELEAMEAELKLDYETAQATWERFLSQNTFEDLAEDMAEKKKRLQAVRVSQSEILERETAIRRKRANARRQATAELTGAELEVYRMQRSNTRERLRNMLDDLLALERDIARAESVAAQLRSPATSTGGRAGDTLALLGLRGAGGGGPLATELEIQASVTELAAQTPDAVDADRLKGVLDGRHEALKKDIAVLTEELLSSTNPPALAKIEEDVMVDALDHETLMAGARARIRSPQLEAEINSLLRQIGRLEAQLENQSAMRRALKEARDLAWETYVTVRRKRAEASLAAQLTDLQVLVASTALEPRRPSSPRPLRNAMLAGSLGLLVAVCVVLALDWWRSGENLDRLEMDDPLREG